MEERNCRYCKTKFQADRLAELRDGKHKKHYCSNECRIKHQTKKDYRGEDWDIIRKEIIARDTKCVLCGTTEYLHVHHITPWNKTKNNTPSNLITLCKSCHYKEDSRMQRFYRPSKKVLEHMGKGYGRGNCLNSGHPRFPLKVEKRD